MPLINISSNGHRDHQNGGGAIEGDLYYRVWARVFRTLPDRGLFFKF